MSGAFDPLELARLAATSRKWDERIKMSHTPLSHDHGTLVKMLQDDRRTLDYFTAHRDAIVAAVSRAEVAEAAVGRVRVALSGAVSVARAGVVMNGPEPEGVNLSEAVDILADAVIAADAAIRGGAS